MPREPHPSDWNRLFDPAHRRRGPIGMFFLFSFLGCLAVLFLVSGSFGVRQVDKRSAELHATQTPAWATAYALGTATSVARTAAALHPAAGTMHLASVSTAGNFRSAPQIVPQTVTGQVLRGDQVALLENRDVSGLLWYRVRLMQTTGTLARGTEGWVSATLLSIPVSRTSANPPAVTTALVKAP